MNMESILKCTANFRDYLLKDLTEPGFAKAVSGGILRELPK